MTEAQVQNVLKNARERDITNMDQYDVRTFLRAKEGLLSASDERRRKDCQEVVNNFVHWMETGERTPSFLEFVISADELETDEEKIESARVRDEYLAAIGNANQSMPHEP